MNQKPLDGCPKAGENALGREADSIPGYAFSAGGLLAIARHRETSITQSGRDVKWIAECGMWNADWRLEIAARVGVW